MKKVSLVICLAVLFCAAFAQADTIVFGPGHLADGTHNGTLDSYMLCDTAALESGSPGWDGGYYSVPWVGGDFSNATARMMIIKFRDLFGSGAIQIPVGSTITSASLELGVATGYSAPPTEIRAFTGLTPWYDTYSWYAGIPNDASYSSADFRWNGTTKEAWGGGTTGDKPRHGIDYTSSYVAAPITATQGSGVYMVDQSVSFDVTADVLAYQAGTLANWGWWIGTNQDMSLGMYQVGGQNAGWVYLPHLVVDYTIPEPITLSLFGLGSLLALRRRK
ncbi:MAG: PEP-CTERM sorting domain-containing protein [Sedimentisphaerales bacterium]